MKQLGLILAVGIFAILPYAGYYFIIHYLLLSPITDASRMLALSCSLGVSPFCVIAASYITLVWERDT